MMLLYTLPGPPDESDSFTHELRGVIPRSFEYLFSLINREKQKVSTLNPVCQHCSQVTSLVCHTIKLLVNYHLQS